MCPWLRNLPLVTDGEHQGQGYKYVIPSTAPACLESCIITDGIELEPRSCVYNYANLGAVIVEMSRESTWMTFPLPLTFAPGCPLREA
jgi:hypothetical protein